MKITKEQIVQLDKGEITVRELFPQVFETQLEAGKWYKDKTSKLLIYAEKIEDRIFGYGFGTDGNWYNDYPYFYHGAMKMAKIYLTPATKEEVETALINEAKRRGFKKGIVIKELLLNNVGSLGCVNPKESQSDKITINDNLTYLYISNLLIFRKGVWAEIIQPKQMTKEEI